MTQPVAVIERLSLFAPLGIRFRDGALNLPVRDGLEVTAYPAGRPWERTLAITNPSGVSAFPRMRDAYDPQRPRPFAIEVVDTQRRFLPIRFDAQAPFLGLFQPCCDSPPDLPDVPLYSAPARMLLPTVGILQADLQVEGTGEPAAWAIVEAMLPGMPVARGMADERGCVLIPLNYSEPRGSGSGSPLGPDGPRLTDQEWPLTLRALYARGSGEQSGIPDLCAVLAQPPAALQVGPLTLRFGERLIVRSQQLSVLLLTPAGSPP